MTRRGAGGLCALMLSACAFASERPFFTERDAATPFADMARFVWRDDAAEQVATYRRKGRVYEITLDHDEEPLRALFIEIDDTPEQDYIAQIEEPGGGQARLYAFFLPTDFGYHIVVAPQALSDDATAQGVLQSHCAARPYNECHFASAADLMALYREAIYPLFVTGGATPPRGAVEQTTAPQAPPDARGGR
jgi:hypothetical protein